VLYPLLTKSGFKVTALRRMGFGIAFSGLAWVFAGMIQLWIDGGDPVSLAWQILPYALLTFGEVLVSATGLEFAYSQSPPKMKGVIMSFWMLSVTFGNVWVLLTNAGRAQRNRDGADREHRVERKRVLDVLLRWIRVRCGVDLRGLCQAISAAGSLSCCLSSVRCSSAAQHLIGSRHEQLHHIGADRGDRAGVLAGVGAAASA
jgi:hypothetical protein